MKNVIASLGILFGLAVSPAVAQGVIHTTGTVNGQMCDIWKWPDSNAQTRTVALKMEGNGNAGHGGYAIQMTYFRQVVEELPGHSSLVYEPVTINAAAEYDGGFGYFVGHERYRNFNNGSSGTIASLYGADDSPLGNGFAATSSIPLNTAAAGAESFVIDYPRYGTAASAPVNANGSDVNLPPTAGSFYALYNTPVTTTWVFQQGMDYPRIDVSVDLSQVKAPGSSTPSPDLVSFDVRGPYGYMVFDNGTGGTITSAFFGDRADQFATLPLSGAPVTRNSTWTWNATNTGARYNGLAVATAAGKIGTIPISGGNYELGLYEPLTSTKTALNDGYAAERSFTSTTYPAQGGSSYSADCNESQVMPSDGTWPYQSLQYSLPCGVNAPTNGQKLAWGSTSFYGMSLSSVYNGQTGYAFTGFPSSHKVNYSVCVVAAWVNSASVSQLLALGQAPTETGQWAATYTAAKPVPAKSNCATVAP